LKVWICKGGAAGAKLIAMKKFIVISRSKSVLHETSLALAPFVQCEVIGVQALQSIDEFTVLEIGKPVSEEEPQIGNRNG